VVKIKMTMLTVINDAVSLGNRDHIYPIRYCQINHGSDA
jgi:hypothetical protein